MWSWGSSPTPSESSAAVFPRCRSACTPRWGTTRRRTGSSLISRPTSTSRRRRAGWTSACSSSVAAVAPAPTTCALSPRDCQGTSPRPTKPPQLKELENDFIEAVGDLEPPSPMAGVVPGLCDNHREYRGGQSSQQERRLHPHSLCGGRDAQLLDRVLLPCGRNAFPACQRLLSVADRRGGLGHGIRGAGAVWRGRESCENPRHRRDHHRRGHPGVQARAETGTGARNRAGARKDPSPKSQLESVFKTQCWSRGE